MPIKIVKRNGDQFFGPTPPKDPAEVDTRRTGLKRGPAGVSIAKAAAESLKLALPVAPLDPKGQPIAVDLPSNIDEWTLEQLSRRYTDFAGLASYAEVQVALVAVERSDAKTYQEQTEAMVGLRGVEGANATERKAAVAMHPDVMAASEVYRVANAKYVLLESLFNGYDRGMRTISREYSRRGLAIER